MSEWEIVPFEGLGNLHFGMSRTEVRIALGGNFKVLEKYRSPTVREAYSQLGIYLDYDDHDRVEFIETTRLCDPTYLGVHFFGRALETVLKQLSDLGIGYEQDVDGYDFPECGFGLYAAQGSIEGVSIYRKGCYDRLRG